VAWQQLDKELNINEYDVFKQFIHEVNINNTPFELQWRFESRNDTNAVVKLNFLNKENSLKERYSCLFKSSPNLDSIIFISQAFKAKANAFARSFKVLIDGIDTIPSQTYLYIKEQSKRDSKAGKMIKTNGYLFSKNKDSLVTKTGETFVYVKKWDLETDSINFRYAFPIKPQSTYPTDDMVMVDDMIEQPALKATFYGNYSLSDQAWIALYNYANRNDISVELTPIEIFYNNPMLGGDDRQWKAEVFLPLKNKE
jgi:effector-binding domain-containing protein